VLTTRRERRNDSWLGWAADGSGSSGLRLGMGLDMDRVSPSPIPNVINFN
jgi:hypothetical protein